MSDASEANVPAPVASLADDAGGGDRFAKVRAWLLLATVALMSLSANVGPLMRDLLPDSLKGMLPGFLKKIAETGKPLYLSPFDVLLPLMVLCLLYELVKCRVRLRSVPVPNLVLAAIAVASILWATPRDLGVWYRSAWFSTVLLAFLGVWVFRALVPGVQAYRRLALLLGAALALCFLYALYQYVQPRGRPLAPGEDDLALAGGVTDVRLGGWYAYRGHLAAQVAMLVPACAAFVALDRDPAVRFAALSLGTLALCVCLSGGGYLGASVGVLAVAGALGASNVEGRWRRAGLAVAALLFVTTVLLPRLPRDNPQVLWRSVTLYVPVDAPEGTYPDDVTTDRLRRHQAVLNRLRQDGTWMRGVGAGNFQGAISADYYKRPYEKPSVRTDYEAMWGTQGDEPMAFGLWETTALELGAWGMVALAWVFLAWAAAALAAFVRAGPNEHVRRTLALASLGAAAGALVFSLYGTPLARGIGGTFAFFMGLALYLNTCPSEAHSEENP
ncbi:MAG: hypothetical protein L6R28_04805 [Planctomycetes bacterium]|nr:hypothetical protein [Planctomycetota bacterium]